MKKWSGMACHPAPFKKSFCGLPFPIPALAQSFSFGEGPKRGPLCKRTKSQTALAKAGQFQEVTAGEHPTGHSCQWMLDAHVLAGCAHCGLSS